MPNARPRATGRPHHHAVKFYGEDSSLFETVAGFLGEGLIDGQPAIVIATQAHAGGILEHLRARKLDVERACRMGDLVILDADEMLALFMVDDGPNAALFERNIGGLIEQTLCGQAGVVVRAYGEMVDILWKNGRMDAAIQLEIFWNNLALKHSFALLCGYSMGSFYKGSEQLNAVVGQHTHVLHPARRSRARVARSA